MRENRRRFPLRGGEVVGVARAGGGVGGWGGGGEGGGGGGGHEQRQRPAVFQSAQMFTRYSGPRQGGMGISLFSKLSCKRAPRSLRSLCMREAEPTKRSGSSLRMVSYSGLGRATCRCALKLGSTTIVSPSTDSTITNECRGERRTSAVRRLRPIMLARKPSARRRSQICCGSPSRPGRRPWRPP